MTAHLTDTIGGSWSVRESTPADRIQIETTWANQFDDPTADCHQAVLDACEPGHDLEPYTTAVVATDARNRVVGFGIASLRNTGDMSDHTTLPESEFSGRDGYLYLSAVRDRWKQKGIGTRLFAERLRWCVEQEANSVYGVAWQNPNGPTSDPLFQKFGFERVKPTPEDYYSGRDCVACEGECTCRGVIYRKELEATA